ncbi:hypothetical protein [Modestobacter roseus]|uniref:hypothetical protein n=1 Tax=Modestobacter roseus TaxID=1181884 RepID=UPI001E48B2F1|nr:hypothetical protein [Modestobacter roseus]
MTLPAAQLLSALALVTGALTLAVTHRPALALGVLLDLLLAAGLLRLAGDPDWQGIATAAAIVALRHLAGAGLRVGARSWRPGPARPGHRPSAGRLARLLRPQWRT